jgi:hypothetical protein
LEQLFGRGWRLHELEQQTMHCYGHAKRLWEVAAEREA